MLRPVVWLGIDRANGMAAVSAVVSFDNGQGVCILDDRLTIS